MTKREEDQKMLQTSTNRPFATDELADEWRARHNKAVRVPRAGHEAALVNMIAAWADYAAAHAEKFEDSIGEDGVLGLEWEAIGDALRGLLNGESGARLDCGTLDGFLLDTMQRNGIETENK